MYNKTKTLSIPVCPEVAAFAVVMETKLQMEGYDNIESWEGIPLEKLLTQVEAKVKRLVSSDTTDAHSLFTKAIVIGNLAMMIAERAAKAKTAPQVEGGPVEPTAQGGTILPFPPSGPSKTKETSPNLPSSIETPPTQSSKTTHLLRARAFGRRGLKTASE